jgi:hypothetical protein
MYVCLYKYNFDELQSSIHSVTLGPQFHITLSNYNLTVQNHGAQRIRVRNPPDTQTESALCSPIFL